ncbi:MAG: hypothetical protein JO025_04985 [Verrucomicrobia bacterium]|nr:hypothetical protein [Verrucomicrobiota bacterium]
MTNDKSVEFFRKRWPFEKSPLKTGNHRLCRAVSLLSVICHLLFVILILASNAFADGGSVQLHSVSGPFDITLFAEPPLPRAGQIDFSALIQDAKSGEPVMDAVVTLTLAPVKVHQNAQPAWYPPSCAVTEPANLAAVPLLHSGASNRLLYGATVQIPSAGVWHVRTEVQRGDQQALVAGTLNIADPLPPVASYWPLFLFPVIAIGLYVLREHARKA